MGDAVQIPKAKGGMTAQTLKVIAILAMTVDHVAYAFVQPYYSPLGIVLHFIGRVTGPVMFFFVAEGYRYTRNVWRYAMRMGVFALISYLPFIWFDTGHLPRNFEEFTTLNVFWTLGIGLLAIHARHVVKNPAVKLLVVFALLFVSEFGDWGATGVAIMLAFDLFSGNFKRQAAVYCAIVAFLILSALFSLFPRGGGVNWSAIGYMIVQSGMFLPIILLRFYNGQRGRGTKWLFYVFYPAHLLAICVIRMAIA